MNKETTAVIGQTKRQSLNEAFINVAVGFGVSLLSTIILFPLMDIESTTSKNIQVTFYFTAISIIRSYALRRYFNKAKPVSFTGTINKFVKFMEGLAKDAPNETKWNGKSRM